MNTAEALHGAARQYCNRQFDYWSTKYSALPNDGRAADNYHYSDEALDVFPRYNVLRAIRVELERMDPSNLPSLGETRDMIILAGEAANDEFTEGPKGPIEEAAMAAEREAFRDYIRELTAEDLKGMEPEPYLRVLSTNESKRIWDALRKRWEITGDYWYPLAETHLDSIQAFQERHFSNFFSPSTIGSLLETRDVARIWELREYGPEYEQDLALLDPHYNGAEGYWTSEGSDWIIYASHESSITVGGWLLDEIKAAWPEWEERLWTTPFYDQPNNA